MQQRRLMRGMTEKTIYATTPLDARHPEKDPGYHITETSLELFNAQYEWF